MMKLEVLSNSPLETQKIAAFFIKTILKLPLRKQALVISLEGNLGSGKTEFLKGIARALHLKAKICSPTFVVMKRFNLRHSYFKFLWHGDCYRLKSTKDLKELGFMDFINDRHNLIFIEWGNKIKKILPRDHLTIQFKIVSRNTRKIIISL